LERGVGEAPPEKGSACRRRKSMATLSGLWLLQMQSFALPTSEELKTDRKVLCTRSRNDNADPWTRVYESKNVHRVPSLAAIRPSDIIRRTPSFCY
jgi:hypothetical protein